MNKKVTGILGILIAVVVVTAAKNPAFLGLNNLQNTARWTGEFGILSIGQAFVIITGGIDLSMGSVVGLVGSLLPMTARAVGAVPAVILLLGLALAIGAAHGLLITKLRMQPFIVTLSGLFMYRGLARAITADATQGFGTEFAGFRTLAAGKLLGVPLPFVLLLGVAAVAAVYLNCTIYGRYLLALGRNLQAARYSGIHTDRMILVAYMISAGLAGCGGILFTLDLNSVQPSGHGNFYELYAIAGAVLGGCSLRGGEGSITGVIIGTAIVRVLYNAINILGIPTQLEFAVIGSVILCGVAADEVIRLLAARRHAGQERRALREPARGPEPPE